MGGCTSTCAAGQYSNSTNGCNCLACPGRQVPAQRGLQKQRVPDLRCRHLLGRRRRLVRKLRRGLILGRRRRLVRALPSRPIRGHNESHVVRELRRGHLLHRRRQRVHELCGGHVRHWRRRSVHGVPVAGGGCVKDVLQRHRADGRAVEGEYGGCGAGAFSRKLNGRSGGTEIAAPAQLTSSPSTPIPTPLYLDRRQPSRASPATSRRRTASRAT